MEVGLFLSVWLLFLMGCAMIWHFRGVRKQKKQELSQRRFSNTDWFGGWR